MKLTKTFKKKKTLVLFLVLDQTYWKRERKEVLPVSEEEEGRGAVSLREKEEEEEGKSRSSFKLGGLIRQHRLPWKTNLSKRLRYIFLEIEDHQIGGDDDPST